MAASASSNMAASASSNYSWVAENSNIGLSSNKNRTTGKQLAVCIRNAYKTYGSGKHRAVIFDGLNMTVPKGSIYGLLGASGCGKTTLLSCILGRHTLDSGNIWVLGVKPSRKAMPGSRVGYMPQELSLYFEFTIRETMLYFGWLSKMKTKRVDERIKFLIPFLDLPHAKSKVGELSGGQQRRVSFAVALLHHPEMLIFDEPTAGVDPILRESIWDHLVEITNDEKTTVIITTHYIDEAKQADIIALMRGGRILAEEAPSSLLKKYKCQNLEDLFLNLSLWQNRVMGDRKNLTLDGPKDSTTIRLFVQGSRDIQDALVNYSEESLHDQMPPYEQSRFRLKYYFSIFKCHRMKALIWKNFLWMIRNVSMTLIIIFVPLAQVILFCYTVGRDPEGLKLSVLNRELKNNEPCNTTSIGDPVLFSCQYLSELTSMTYEMVMFGSHDKAVEAVKNGSTWAVLEFSNAFTASLIYRFEHIGRANNSIIENSCIDVYLDKSDRVIALQLNRDFHLAFRGFSTKAAQRHGYDPRIVSIPVVFEKPVFGTLSPSFLEFATPGAIMTMIFFLALSTTSSALIIERNEGMIERALVAGVTEVEMLLAHAITHFIIVFGNALSIVIYLIFVYKIPNHGDLKLIFLMMTINGICGMAYGFVVAYLTSSESGAIYLSMGSCLPLIMLCGMIWPIEGMDKILRTVSRFLPLTYPTETLRSIMARGWKLDHEEIYFGFISISVWTVIFVFIAIILSKIRKL